MAEASKLSHYGKPRTPICDVCRARGRSYYSCESCDYDICMDCFKTAPARYRAEQKRKREEEKRRIEDEKRREKERIRREKEMKKEMERERKRMEKERKEREKIVRHHIVIYI